MLVISANAIDKEIGIYYLLHDVRITIEQHCHDGFYELLSVQRGTLVHEAEHLMTLKRGDIVFLPAGSAHKLSEPSADLQAINLCIAPKTLQLAIDYLRIDAPSNRIIVCHAEEPLIAYLDWNHQRLTCSRNAAERITLIRNAMVAMLPLCLSSVDSDDWFDALTQKMEKRVNFQGGVRRMQELAFCSPAHLCRVCRKRTGLTPTQLVDRIRIQYACNLLRHSTYSIRDICAECGYNNLGYFYRRFEQTTGESPGRYQTAHKLPVVRLDTDSTLPGEMRITNFDMSEPKR